SDSGRLRTTLAPNSTASCLSRRESPGLRLSRSNCCWRSVGFMGKKCEQFVNQPYRRAGESQVTTPESVGQEGNRIGHPVIQGQTRQGRKWFRSLRLPPQRGSDTNCVVSSGDAEDANHTVRGHRTIREHDNGLARCCGLSDSIHKRVGSRRETGKAEEG